MRTILLSLLLLVPWAVLAAPRNEGAERPVARAHSGPVAKQQKSAAPGKSSSRRAVNRAPSAGSGPSTAAAEERDRTTEPNPPTKAGTIAERSAEELNAEVQRLNSELISIRQASANALQIQAERDELQQNVIHLERELESTKREKQALDEDQRQRWFFIGAVVLTAGLLLGLILPRLTWRKRSSWDSF